MKIFMSQSGFSLVQGMMLAGVVAGSSLVATRLLTDQKLAQKSAETRDQVEQLHKMVYSTLQDKDACTKTLFSGSAGILGKTPGNLTIIPNPSQVVTKAGQVVVSVGNAYMNNNVMLLSMTLDYNSPTETDLSRGSIVFKYQRLTQNTAGTVRLKDGYGAKDISKKVVIRMQRDPLYKDIPSGTFPKPFTSCYLVTGDSDGASNGEDGNTDLNKTMCEQLNSGDATSAGKSFFIWDDTTSTCKPKDNVCKVAGEVNTGINSNGEVECRRIQDWMDTSKLIDQTSQLNCPVNQWVKVDTTGGKIRIYCSP